MPITINHVLTATTPDNTSYEIRPSNWNSQHAVVLSLSGTDISNAFTNNAYVTFGTNTAGYMTGSVQTNYAATNITTNAIALSNSSLFQQTSATSAITSAAFPSSNSTLLIATSQSSLFQQTSATSAITSAAFPSSNSTLLIATSQSSLFQQTSATSAITSAAFPSANSTLLIATSNSSLFQQTSATSAITSAAFPSANTTKFAGTGTTFAGTNISASMTLNSNGLNLALSGGAGGGGGGIYAAAGTQTATSGTVVFANSNNVTFGMSGSSQITASASFSQSVQTQASGNIGATGFATTSTTGTAVVGTNNTTGFTLGVPSFITTYAAQTNQTVASGGIAGTGFTSASTAGTALVGTLNSSGLSLGIPAYITTYVAQTNQPVAYSAANGSANFSTLTFANSNGVSFSTGTQGLYATVATNYQSQGAYLTTAMQSQSSSVFAKTGFTTSSTAGTAITGTHNTNGLQLNIPAYITTYTQPNTINISASGNTTGTLALVSTGTLILAGGNNITLSQNGQSITISGANVGGAQTAISGIQISNATYTSGTVTFQNANGISFGSSGANGISASYTVPSTAGLISAINFSAGTTNSNATNIVFSNSNNISFGLNGATVTATATFAQSVQTQASGNIGATGFATTSTTGTAIVGTNNTTGFTLGVPAYITTYASQTVQTQASGGIAGTGFTSASTAGTAVVGTLNSSGLSLGIPAYITTYASQTVQTQASGGIAGSGFTSASTAGTAVVGTLNSSGLSLGIPAYITTFTQPSTAGLISAINVCAGTTSNNLSAITFANSNNLSFGLSGSVITGSASFSQTVQTQASGAIAGTGFTSASTAGTAVVGTLNSSGLSLGIPAYITTFTQPSTAGLISAINVSAGTTSNNLSAITFANSNNLTFGLSGSVITGSASFSQSVQTQASGNIGATGFVTTSTAGTAIVGTNNTTGFTLGVPPYITTYASQTVQTQASGGIAGTGFTSATTAGTAIVGTLNSGGLNLGVPAYITTYASQTVQTQASGGIAGTATSVSGNASITLNSNGLALNVNNLAGTGFATTTVAGTAVVGTHNTTGLTLAIPPYITTYVAGAGAAIAAGTQTGSTGTIVFSNSNNITFGMSNSSIVTASFSQTNQTQASGGIAGTGFTSASTVGTAIVGTLNSGGLNLGVPAYITTYASQTVQTQASGNIAGSGFTSASTAGTAIVGTLNSGGINLGIPAYITTYATSQGSYNIASMGTLTFGGATGGTTFSNSATTIGLHAGSNITLSQSSNSIIIYGAGAAGTDTAYARGNTTLSSTGTLAQSSLNFAGSGGISAGVSNGSIVYSAPNVSSLIGTSGISISSTSNSIYVYANPNQASYYNPFNAPQTTAGLIGQGSIAVQPMAGLPSALSFSQINVLASVSNSQSSNSSYAGAISLYAGIYTNNASTLSLLSSGSQSYQWSNTGTATTNSATLISGMRMFSIPIGLSITQAGDYWIGFLSITSSTNANWFTAQNAFITQMTSPANIFGAATTATNQLALGLGMFGTTSNAMPVSMAFTNITGQGYNAFGTGFAGRQLPLFYNAINATA